MQSDYLGEDKIDSSMLVVPYKFTETNIISQFISIGFNVLDIGLVG